MKTSSYATPHVLCSARDIRQAIATVRPSRIAVAYLGQNWSTFISGDDLEEIVLSPTFGSNPKAIEALMRSIGDSNVHFLDNLHSKMYIGERAAVVGSNNLSDNGFSDGGLREAAILLSHEGARRKLLSAFASYKSEAMRAYPTHAAKIKRLQQLKRETDIATWKGVGKRARDHVPDIGHYNSSLDRIHVAWYGSSPLSYNKGVIRSAVPQTASVSIDDFFQHDLAFLESDDVRVGDWILQWRCRDNGMPVKNGDVSWMQVHHVIPHGFMDEEGDGYTKLAGQCKPKDALPASPPFRLDAPTKELVRNLISSLEFPQLLSLDDKPWQLSKADAVTARFIARLKQLAAKSH